MYFCVALTVPSWDSRAEGSDGQWTVACWILLWCVTLQRRGSHRREGKCAMRVCVCACLCRWGMSKKSNIRLVKADGTERETQRETAGKRDERREGDRQLQAIDLSVWLTHISLLLPHHLKKHKLFFLFSFSSLLFLFSPHCSCTSFLPEHSFSFSGPYSSRVISFSPSPAIQTRYSIFWFWSLSA